MTINIIFSDKFGSNWSLDDVRQSLSFSLPLKETRQPTGDLNREIFPVLLTQHVDDDPSPEGAPLTGSSLPWKLIIFLHGEALVVPSIPTSSILDSKERTSADFKTGEGCIST